MKHIRIIIIACLSSILPYLLHLDAQANESTMPQNHTDNYSWMETQSETTNQWLQDQTEQAKTTINALPWRKAVEKYRFLFNDKRNKRPSIEGAGKYHFYERSTSRYPYNSRLFVREKNGTERLLVDPPVGMDIAFFYPSPDGRYVAYGLSRNGSEIASINILDINKGTRLKDVIPRTRYPRINWRADNRSFFYSRLPPEQPLSSASKSLAGKKIYLHHIGQNYTTDDLIFDSEMVEGSNANSYNDVELYSSSNSDWLLASISPSTSGYSNDLYAARTTALDGRKMPWVKIIDRKQNVANFVFSGKWLFMAKYNASSGYTVTKLSLDDPQAPEQKIIEWANGELTGFTTRNNALYISFHDSGTPHFIKVDIDNSHHIQDIPLPFNGEVTAIFSGNKKQDIRFTLQNWIHPPRIYSYSPANNSVKKTHQITSKAYDFYNYEAQEIWVESKDKVQIPLTIIHRRGMKLEGSARTWLYAYGAYGISTFPYFDPLRLMWLRNGGIIAIAHVRGGGELGPAWHEAGRAAHKENSINDFIACADYLVEKGYTTPKRLVASSESAGGIIVGRAITLRPELFAAVAIDVGILNTSRLNYIPIGPMNVDEFGSPETTQGMADLRKIDAYEHLEDGVRYPAVMLTVGLNDNRVSPWQSAKFAARLEAIASKVENPNPVLIMAEKNAGHYSSTYEQYDTKLLNTVSFFLWQTTK